MYALARQISLKDKKTGKIFGVIKNDTLIKKVDRKKHLYRKYNGYAIQSEILSYLTNNDVRYVKVEEIDTGDVYLTNTENYQNFGIIINYGYGEQVVLPLSYFKKISPS